MSEYDDPFKSPDSTVIRPRPGEGRRASPEAQPHRLSVPVPPVEALSAGALDAVGLGLGPLVRAASPLLLLAGQLRGTLTGPDFGMLRRHAMDEIRRFEDRARASGMQNETVLAARYAICAALDEAILSTPWGAQSEWAQQSLLVTLHRESWGGEKFFDMIDRVSADPRHHIDLMEILYLCLAMGFAGKYHLVARGQSQLENIQHDLHRRIREHRGPAPAELSPRWRGIQDRRNPLVRYVPWWVVGAGVVALLFMVFLLYSLWLRPDANRIVETMARLGKSEAPLKVAGRGLRAFLEVEEAKGLLTVEEEGAKVVLRDFFASGSDQLKNAQGRDTLQAICRALNQNEFSGNRLQVIGHTDKQPPRVKYSGNQELSQKRAATVASELRGCLTGNKNRISPLGKGDSEAYGPEHPGDYMAASRRVEIVLVGGV